MASDVAVIAGAGAGLSASLARLLTREGFRVVLAARNVEKLSALTDETGALAVETDVADVASVASLFDTADKAGPLALAVFNASARTRGPIAELDAEAVKQALLVGAYGGFLVGQQAARRLLARGSGSILFTGATASVKGFPGSAGFAMPKFGLRGLAQSMARELAPQNIHVAHFIIDGQIEPAGQVADPDRPDRRLSPDAIAEAYLTTHRQHRSAWSSELELRPWAETF
ncbi:MULTISPECIES: SDR family NAD(P)-dependent oxidoreductase [unclassified Mesorhizobium]|uniref:SDR family NAD(P)-dependent oxidoreductase n=1 Tax=unclassified Mesorhizobium TaxID=325217 RepID=UPI000FCC6D93|nr:MULTISPECIES: SDR family NAD(P)-dependent oxidoreductase [unclassified Mesorhizobium]RUZ80953.1 SDR family NAD(P)-dependent oxidoreductase [Mesorhizobium sp. M7A.F.Ca.US.003.02.2.1]RVA53484.1 SDR family NAD(P)-dependent oxidoreductase [Mesorhizobium sp. M7A.F.Ca.US.001.01.1.1]MDF3153587.1 SDR family NAD(P)-dependent oxidoreductase [Mesorhizobium sp. XAP10]MDF3246116.1 SDR family NAD(P)-dependent oxidoreductase [Mesorhizobium sp. XAP4]RUZ00932.1 SDR family NAD(P)-dependent oxidoreductase [Me